jgi:hypothetical protein
MGLIALFLPGALRAQGRNTKVYYDDPIALGSQPLQQARTRYFQILTTPAPEDPDGGMAGFWGPRLDAFFEGVCANLHLEPDEICRYLLYPRYFEQLETLVLQDRLHPAAFDSLLEWVTDIQAGAPPPPLQPLALVQPRAAPPALRLLGSAPRPRRWSEQVLETSGDTLFVWLPGEESRTFQRCVLYRTLHDFLATPIGPALPEGVAGFVPTRDPALPIVIYASIGEHRLRRTAQHEIGHAIVESIANYLRHLAPARNRAAVRDTSCNRGWRPGSGGFSMVTHENYAEYLAFPHGKMEPALRAALIEMVAENRLDGLAAMSVGARSQASSYVEGPARLVFLAETFGHDVPKKLLVNYNTSTCGFLDWIEALTGHDMQTLEQLYRRWLREKMWGEYLSTSIPDTLGGILAEALSGVQRDGRLLLHRVRGSRQEIVLRGGDAAGTASETRIARDLDGIDRLPLFSSSDLHAGSVVAVVRRGNRESLLLWEASGRQRLRALDELGAVREVRDPRWSPSGRQVVFRVVDRGGRNALGLLDVDRDRARLLLPYRWAELSHPSFAGEHEILFASTATPTSRTDIFAMDLATGESRNLTGSPDIGEDEPLRINGRLVYLSDQAGVPRPVEQIAPGRTRELLDLPFPVSHLQRSDTLLSLVATSLRHESPGGRALWGFPLARLGLEAAPAAVPVLAAAAAGAAGAAAVAALPGASLSLQPHGLLEDMPTGAGEAAPVLVIAPYKQKWRLMPLGVSLSNSSTRTRGATFVGIDTEFHDQSAIVAVGQNGDFDRFGLVQYRNRAARTHWQVGGYYRSLVRSYFESDSLATYDRNQSEQGLLVAAQYHRSLVTRLGAGASLTRRTDARGLLVRQEDITLKEADAPIAGLQLPGLDPRGWALSFGGVSDPALLLDRSPAGIARWAETEKQVTAAAERIFEPTETYVRPNLSLGGSYSRDTRIWSDLRGPRTGSLFVLHLASGFNASGTRTYHDGAQQDSLQQDVPAGVDRLSVEMLFLTHRRLGPLDLAMRLRAYANGGPQAVVYGVGGLYSVAGYPRGIIRSAQVAYANMELRAQLWDYSRFSLPVWSPVLPAGEGFFFFDAGTGADSSGIYSYGLGLRLRLGILAFEWRQPLRSGLRKQSGFNAAW